MELLDLVAPLLVKAVCKRFTVVLRGLAYKCRIVPHEVNNAMNVTVEPTAAVLIYKRGKLAIVLPKVSSVLPLLFRGGFFTVRNTAPRKKSATSKVDFAFRIDVKNIAVCIVKKIPTGKDTIYSVFSAFLC